jgi:hypothetical protein
VGEQESGAALLSFLRMEGLCFAFGNKNEVVSTFLFC